MKTRFALLALLLLALPTAAAQMPGKETVNVMQSDQGLTVIDVLEWPSSIPHAFFWAPQGAAAVKVALVRADNTETAQTQSKTGTIRDGQEEYRVALANATAPVRLKIEYVMGGDSVTLRPWYDAGEYVVFATALQGQEPRSSTLGFSPLEGQRYHSTKQDTNANESYVVTFATVPHTGATNKDQTDWLWIIGAFLVGFLLAYIAFRKGWIAAQAKATKFQKGGAMESRSMLEARRRTLLAALKDLEQGHETKEVGDDVYGPLKEEYKAQAVRVMRTLEEKKGPDG